MKAGRELDALVAEKVMGFPYGQQHGEIRENSSGSPFCSICKVAGSWRDGDLFSEPCIQHYSTDIADAWQVVEKLREQGFNFGIQHPCRRHGGQAFVYFHRYGGSTIGHQSTALADTGPRAICLAALKAVCVEVAK